MNKNTYVLGGSQTDFQRNYSKEGKTFLAMMKEVVLDTLQATSLSLREIQKLSKENRIAIFLGNFDGEQYINQGHLGAFFTQIANEFVGIPAARYEAACASSSVAIDAGITKINAGEIDLAIVIGIEIMKTVSPQLGGDYLGTAAYYDKESKGIEFPFPKLFGKLADALVEKYKLNETRFINNLCEISRINYENAKRNPNAQTRSWFMNKEHALQRGTTDNPSIGGKLCISDCSQITDGAACVVLSSRDYATDYSKKRNIRISQIPRIKGKGFRVAPILFLDKISESSKNPYILPWTRQAILDAYNEAKLTVESIDLFETHDCFTSSEYAAISAFGLTRPGKEYEVIEDGSINFQGKHPINPSGGLIGVGHPVGATGVRMLLDLYKQIAGKAGDYQVPNAKNAIMLNIGGSATTNISFIVGK